MNARKEVILSAGAIGSPHILLLSGVGPAEQVSEVGIKPIVDLPGVGANYQDHVYLMQLYYQEEFSLKATLKLTPRQLFNIATITDNPICRFNSSVNRDSEWPDAQLYVFYSPLNEPTGALFGNMFWQLYNLRHDVFYK